MPTIPASMEQMAASVERILAKLEKVDVNKISAELLETLQTANKLVKGANKLINETELHGTVDDLKGSLLAFKDILRKLAQRVEPITVNLENAIGAGHQALEKAQITLGLMDKVLKPDSPLQFRFIQLTEELAETARSIRDLVGFLERHPNAIIFGKNPSGEK